MRERRERRSGLPTSISSFPSQLLFHRENGCHHSVVFALAIVDTFPAILVNTTFQHSSSRGWFLTPSMCALSFTVAADRRHLRHIQEARSHILSNISVAFSIAFQLREFCELSFQCTNYFKLIVQLNGFKAKLKKN